MFKASIKLVAQFLVIDHGANGDNLGSRRPFTRRPRGSPHRRVEVLVLRIEREVELALIPFLNAVRELLYHGHVILDQLAESGSGP